MINNKNDIDNNKKSKNLLLYLIIILIILASVKIGNKYFSKNNILSKKDQIEKEFKFPIEDISKDLELKALNGEAILEGYNSNELILNVSYIPKNKEYEIDFYKNKSKNYVLDFDDSKFYKVSIQALIPKDVFKNIKLSTVNSKSDLNNLKSKNIFCDSINGDSIIKNSNGKNITINNMNGSIILENSSSKNLEISNMNNTTSLDDFDAKNIILSNINGSIDIKNNSFIDYKDYNWKVKNQNGSITLEIDEKNINYKIDAKASTGEVKVKKDNLIYSEKTPNTIVAKTEKQDKSYKSLNLFLETANSAIILK